MTSLRRGAHFGEGPWSDFVRGLVGDAERRAMASHLATGCERCNGLVAAMRLVAEAGRRDARLQPSAAAVRAARAVFAVHQAEAPSGLRKLALELRFDSRREPALAGVRALGMGPRRMAFSDGELDLDLSLGGAEDGAERLLCGELLRCGRGPLEEVPVFLLAGGRVVDHGLSDEMGGFQLDASGQGPFRLRLFVGDDGLIDLPLEP